MATFTYTAVKNNGETYRRTVEASDRFAIYEIVRKEGGSITSITESASRYSLASVWGRLEELFATVKEIDKIIVARNLSTMIHAGLSLSRGLDVMARQTKNRKLKNALTAVNRDVTEGVAFHEAIAKFPKIFSSLFVSMVRAGEESGKLSESLSVIANQMEQAYELKRKIRGALIYPSIIIIAMIGIGILMLMFVVPTLSQTFQELGADLPASTQAIITISNFLASNVTISIIGILAVIVLFVFAARTKQGGRVIDFVILHLPIISELVRETNAARTTRTLSSLLSAGVDIITALSITEDVLQNSYYKEVLGKAQEHVRKGDALADVFVKRSDIYPVMVGDMMAVGEETGQLSHMLLEIATFFERDVAQRTKDLSTVIEPILMIVIGGVVGFFAISMISPIYSISESI